MSALRAIRSAYCLRRDFGISPRFDPRPSLHKSALFILVRNKSKMAKARLQNAEIKHAIVQVVDEETKRLHPPTRLADLLASLDLKTHAVELVGDDSAAVVRVIDKKAAMAARREQKAMMKGKPLRIEYKEIQMTWGVAMGDIGHKLKKARDELEKGNRVDIVLAPKPTQKHPRLHEMEERMQEIVNMMQGVAKAGAVRTLNKVLGIGVIRFQRPRQLGSEATSKAQANPGESGPNP